MPTVDAGSAACATGSLDLDGTVTGNIADQAPICTQKHNLKTLLTLEKDKQLLIQIGQVTNGGNDDPDIPLVILAQMVHKVEIITCLKPLIIIQEICRTRC